MVYVDKLFKCASENARAFFVGTRTGHRWCHLWSDGGDCEELHVFARSIGLRREWFQSGSRTPHYDLVPSKRALAVAAGAVEIDAIEWFRRKKFWQENIG